MADQHIHNLLHRLDLRLRDNRERMEAVVAQFQSEYPWHPDYPGYTLQYREDGDYCYVEWRAYRHSLGGKALLGRRYRSLPPVFWKTRAGAVKRRFREYQAAANKLRRERTALMEKRRKVIRLLSSLPEPALPQISNVSDHQKALRRQQTKDRLVLKQPHI